MLTKANFGNLQIFCVIFSEDLSSIPKKLVPVYHIKANARQKHLGLLSSTALHASVLIKRMEAGEKVSLTTLYGYPCASPCRDCLKVHMRTQGYWLWLVRFYSCPRLVRRSKLIKRPPVITCYFCH